MEMSHGDALVILKNKTSSAEKKLKALSMIFFADPKSIYGRLTKKDLWELCKFLHNELLQGYDDVTITELNPCYHCYLGVAKKCVGCDLRSEEWARQLESPYYKKEIKFKNILNQLLESEL